MKKIWLARHGETVFNREGKLQGASDSELTHLGLQQAERLRHYFKDHKLDAIYSSDLKRARLTAEPLCKDFNLALQSSPVFRERSFGIFDGLPAAQYKTEAGEAHYDLSFAPPGGESLLDVCQRARDCLQMLVTSPENNILLVSHGGFNRCLLQISCNLPEDSPYALEQGNCCINRMDQAANGTFALELYNYLGHLEISL